ncbi:amidase [Chachezhania sediminis]|uniref:amidase family protein n=1 Tax=Chachezhania sediminis TaxID=2599291 RepID=UPI00131CEF09|nr:amidase family protein [Chachezhania sediminis]
MRDEFWPRTAAELATAIAVGDLSGVDPTEAAIARMKAVKLKLGAMVDALPEEALEGARADDTDGARREELGILHGVPVTTRMNADMKARATANGGPPSRT